MVRTDDHAVVPPTNIEAEQAVLGSALANNGLVERCPWLRVEHFAEPIHGRIWQAVLDAVGRDERADALMLRRLFDHDPGLRDLDGARYLARLAGLAEPVTIAADHARDLVRLARLREIIAIGEAMALKAYDPTASDPASIVAEHRERLDAVCIDDTRPSMDHLDTVVDEVAARIAQPPELWPTDVPVVDASLGGGIAAGYVLGLEARMKNFKTGVAHTLLLALARQQVPSCYLALEMGSVRLAQRMLGQVGGFNANAFRSLDSDAKRERMLQRVEEARSHLRDTPLWFADRPGIRFSQLRALADQAMLTLGVRAFVLDYWQLVQPDRPVKNRAEFLADVAQWCADHAHAHGTTWLICSQENRDGHSLGSDGLARACDWFGVLHKHEQRLYHASLGFIETLWIDVKFARDSAGENIGSEDRPLLFIHQDGPHLAQLP